MPGSSSGLGSRRHSHTPDAGSMAALGATRDRRHSTSSSSDASGSLPDAGPSARQYSNENIEYLPARLAKVTTSKPAANPLQFVKVGPCDLYRSAQEQIRKVEQVKKMKAEVRDEAEDWQSNLDNWKSSRRKRQEHIIERVVEVKKLELEEHDRSRRKSKTFSEILEERRGRKLSLPMYQEEDAHDLSDLGITPGAPSRNGNGDADGGSGSEMGDRDDASAGQADGAQNGHSDGSAGSPEPPAEPPQEYTYERAIQSYVDFAETRVRNGHSAGSRRPQPPPPPAKPRRDSAPAACAPRPPPASLPNVDVGKRRELFEKAAESASQQQQAARRAPASAKSVRDRLSSLEKQADAAAAPPAPSPPAKPRAGARDRLGSAGSPAGSPVKDAAFQVKLANFEGAGDSPTSPRSPSPGAASAASAASAAPVAAAAAAGAGNGSRRAQLHRSLDSLDVGPGAAASAAADLLSEAFERVQSLQALDCCGSAAPLAAAASSSELLAASSQSGDTDREDSGIHTADVSCSVSQADEPVDEAEPVVPGDADGHDADASEAAGASGDSTAEALDAGDISEETATTVGSEVPPHVDSPGTTPPTSPMSPTPAYAAGAFSGTDSGDEEEQLIAVTAPLPALAAVPEEQLDLSAALVPAMSLPQPLLPQPAAAPQAQTPPAASAEPSAPTVAVVPAPAPAAVPDPVVALVEEIPEPLPQTPAEPPAPQPPPAAFALEPLAPLAPLAAGPLASPGDASQLPPLSLTGDLEIVGGLAFPLGPPTSAEPPKEKPPPPPTELSDEEEPLPAESPLRRLDSTKRIKKEIRRKRSDFLGIAGRDDLDSEEPALTVAPPPDMAALLAEERRLQQQLFRRSLASESDAADAAESRDSGVELERSAAEDAASPEPHSRTNSELFGHTSLTSEEEEVTRREKEIIASLEQEEQWRRGDSIGEQLAERLRVLEMEKAELDRRRVEEEGMRREEERRLAAREAALRLHESTDDSSELQEPLEESSDTGEALRREQARLDAQREHLRELESPILSTPMQQPQSPQHRWSAGPTLQSYGSRQSDIASVPAPVRRPPPPAPPAKPQRMASQEQRERDNSIRSSRVPSADCLTLESNRGNLTTAQSSAVQQSMQPHQMSRQTLQALSAAPRSRLITNDTWIQARRKQESTRPALNTQHWLIQEAEHRRLTEQAQRCAPPPRRPPPPQQQWAHHQPPPPPPPPRPEAKPLPDAIIQTLTQRVQGRTGQVEKKKAASINLSPNREPAMPLKQFPVSNSPANNLPPPTLNGDSQEKMLSVSGKKKCSHCGEELGRGAAMIIESLRLFYHIDCFKCCVCHVQLGDGLMGTDVRVRNSKLHCHNCYSSEDGVKFSCV